MSDLGPKFLQSVRKRCMNSCVKNGGAPRRRFPAFSEKSEGRGGVQTPPRPGAGYYIYNIILARNPNRRIHYTAYRTILDRHRNRRIYSILDHPGLTPKQTYTVYRAIRTDILINVYSIPSHPGSTIDTLTGVYSILDHPGPTPNRHMQYIHRKIMNRTSNRPNVYGIPHQFNSCFYIHSKWLLQERCDALEAATITVHTYNFVHITSKQICCANVSGFSYLTLKLSILALYCIPYPFIYVRCL